uniref:NADH-ubiquinone oxidoreductase chain 4L n=1 Tax=Tituria pyramidata TaxID=2713555 RepID=A0A6G6D4A0_9HEMI|nr:NADH dehydrogenase subunit 4L [Tituria pyramidata]QIE11352.1 NADH dehydrogenase subunit 4L [Tituria pyramidata]
MKFIYLYMFFMSMLSLTMMRKHTLMSLLSLEFMMMSLLLNIMLYCMMMKYSMYLFLFMLTLLVCEGVLGLSILINMIRCQGNDYMNSMMSW